MKWQDDHYALVHRVRRVYYNNSVFGKPICAPLDRMNHYILVSTESVTCLRCLTTT